MPALRDWECFVKELKDFQGKFRDGVLEVGGLPAVVKVRVKEGRLEVGRWKMEDGSWKLEVGLACRNEMKVGVGGWKA